MIIPDRLLDVLSGYVESRIEELVFKLTDS